jgi:hypothetical protein
LYLFWDAPSEGIEEWVSAEGNIGEVDEEGFVSDLEGASEGVGPEELFAFVENIEFDCLVSPFGLDAYVRGRRVVRGQQLLS